MAILEYTFTDTRLEVQDGKPVEIEGESETLYFNLRHKGNKIFEQLHGKSILSVLSKVEEKNKQEAGTKLISDKKFINNLICASWLKIENNVIHNNISTVNELRKKPYFDSMADDMAFVAELMEMMSDSLPKPKKSNGGPPPKKKT